MIDQISNRKIGNYPATHEIFASLAIFIYLEQISIFTAW